MNCHEISKSTPETQDAITELHLEVIVRYLKVKEGDDMRPILRRLVLQHIGPRLLTSDLPHVELEDYQYSVVQLSEGAESLYEDEIAEWISLQIESGSFDLEDLPRRMARWALSSPADMRNELAERMGKESI